MKKSKLLAAVLTSATLIFGSLGIVSCSDGGGSDDNKKPVTPKYEVTDLSVESVKKAFVEGDTIPDVSNFTVTATLNGVADTVIPSTDYTVSIPVENETDDGKLKFSGNSETEEIEVTITLVKDTTKTASCKITIARPIAKIELDVTSLTKTSYKPGDAISTEGVVVKAFANENDAEGTDVTDKAAITVDPATAASDTSKVTIKAAYLGKEDSKDASITIKSLEKIEVTVEDITGEFETGTATGTVFADKVKVKAVYGTGDNEEKVEVSDAKITFNPETLTTDSASENVSVTITATYNEKTATANATVTVKNANAPIDMTSWYKSYYLNSETASMSDKWDSGTTYEKKEDGTWNVTAGNKWAATYYVACLAFKDLKKGTIGKYAYIVIDCDLSNFTLSSNAAVKIPNTQLNVAEYAHQTSTGVLYQVPVDIFDTKDTATEFGVIFEGTGSLTVKEIYLAAEEEPVYELPTSITVTPASSSVASGAKVTFTVEDSNYDDVTEKCTFEIANSDTTSSSIASNVLTAGTTAGTVTVNVSYTPEGGTELTTSATVSIIEVTNLIKSVSFTQYNASNIKNGPLTDAKASGITDNYSTNGSFTHEKAAATDWGNWASQLTLTAKGEDGSNLLTAGKKYFLSVTIVSESDLNMCCVKTDTDNLFDSGFVSKYTANEPYTYTTTFTAKNDLDSLPILFANGVNDAAVITYKDFVISEITE